MESSSGVSSIAKHNIFMENGKRSLILLKWLILSWILVSLRSILTWWLCITFLSSLYIIYLAIKVKTVAFEPSLPSKRKFVFLENARWRKEALNLSIDPKALDIPVIKKSPDISRLITRFSDLIVGEFIDSWFKKLAPANTQFQDSIKLELRHVYSSIGVRMMNVDVLNVLVHKLIPKVTEHYAKFVTLNGLNDASYSLESKSNQARGYNNGKLHEGVTLEPVLNEAKAREKAYLRKKVKSILPYFLSLKESENSLVISLLTEILACTVLANVFDVIAEGDFWNQLIVKVVGSNLHHRNQVKRLREALQQHTSQKKDQMIRITETSKLPPLKAPISPECVRVWSARILDCTSSEERSYFSDLLARKEASLYPASGTYLNDSAAIRKLISTLSESPQSLAHAHLLEAVLGDPKYTAIFREFLRFSKHEIELDLWFDIELMRAPLEGSNISEVPLLLEFSNKDDIVKIFERYFGVSHLQISDEIRFPVETYVSHCSQDDMGLYQQARQALFSLQNRIFMRMKEVYFIQFQLSNMFGDIEALRHSKRSFTRVTSTSFPQTQTQKKNDITDRESDIQILSSVSPAVVKAVETAFEEIMNSSSSDRNSKLQIDHTTNLEVSQKLSCKSSQCSLFGDTGSSGPSPLSGSYGNSSSRLSAFFENNSDSDSDTDSAFSESLDSDDPDPQHLSNLELLLAAPGDLSLAEKINVLNEDISKLTEQSEILVSLLKKAELTNNVAELKILRRSNGSLEKEINLKELQKQQYIVQENDNSLFGKSKVKIQSCVFGKDESLPYVMYVIEVQKYSSEDPDEIVAGWIVARRFSQFHKLHEYLKKRYNEVNEVKFPKKNMPYLKFQKTQQIETRKPLLQKYLQDLLKIPHVCSDPAFRSFLSSDNFHVGKLGKVPSRNKSETILSKFYRDSGEQLKNTTNSHAQKNEEMLLNIKEMERELKQFDEIQRFAADKVPFVKPISDFLLTVFDLSKSNWLRGRALLVILQQLLGSTIERTITSYVELLKQELKLKQVIENVQRMLFPNGRFRESPEIRSRTEQMLTRKEAFTILRLYMSETCSKIFGLKNTSYACENMLQMLQNDYLNKHLIFEVFDEICLVLFPELGKSSVKI